MNSQGNVLSRATKVTILVEAENGLTYQLNFGGEEGRTLAVESALNTEFMTTGHGMYPMYQHPTKREFNLKINY